MFYTTTVGGSRYLAIRVLVYLKSFMHELGNIQHVNEMGVLTYEVISMNTVQSVQKINLTTSFINQMITLSHFVPSI